MPAYVAFLRAINLGKNRKVPMADLRECLTAACLTDVETHIQTGNVFFRTTMRSLTKVEEHLEEVLAARFGFDIPSIVFTAGGLRQVYDDALAASAPHDDVTGELRYVHLFKPDDVPAGDEARAIAAWAEPGEAALVVGRAVHVWVDVPTQQAKFFNAFRKPLAPGTNRTLKVVATLAERWGG